MTAPYISSSGPIYKYLTIILW